MAFDNSHYEKANRSRGVLAAALAVVGAIVPTTLVIALFMQPPPGKWAYLLQWKVYGKQPEPPANYTGRWREWDADGRLWSVTTYKNGVPHGLNRTFVFGFPDGIFGEYRDGKTWQGMFFEFRFPGVTPCLHPLDLYKEGELVANVPLDLESVDDKGPNKLVVKSRWQGTFTVTTTGGVVEVE